MENQTHPIKDRAAIGADILCMTRNELYINFRYMDVMLCALQFLPDDAGTESLATDGEVLHYNGKWLCDRYLRSSVVTNRAYLHVIFHCMLRHIGKVRNKVPALWDLACDVAVESLLNDLSEYACLDEGFVPPKQKFIARCAGELKVLTAEGIYRCLQRWELPREELERLHRAFYVDDHSMWVPEDQDQEQQRQEQDTKWQDISRKTNIGMEYFQAPQSRSGNTLAKQLQVAVRDDVDYRAFLRRFAAPHEVMQVDGDAFDYIFYTYGLQTYGNMPLIEPPESKEERRIEDLVIAVDTSMSTTGRLVQDFLSCTYAILRSTETFTRKVNIRILQCDDKIQSDTAIHDLSELQEYMEHFELQGGSATDFRPVFRHIEELKAQGAFTSLRGLIYFTDGMGVYPTRRPNYDVAFLFLEEPPLSVRVPAWATRLVITESTLEDAQRQLEPQAEEFEYDADARILD